MYGPFVLAFNYALDELSKTHVDGLPGFEPGRQIVFAHSSDQPMKPSNHWRTPRVKPDIVLLQWDHFVKRLSTRSPTIVKPSYSKSYSGDICLTAPGLDLTWRAVRSTVEMKIKGLPNPIKLPMTFDKGFEDLEETAPYTPVVDDAQFTVTSETAPMKTCECGIV